MLIVLGVVLVLLGAWHLLAPRASFLVRRGERPGRYLSRAQLASARTRGGAVAVLGTFALVLAVATAPGVEQDRPDEAAQAWGVTTSMGPGRVRIVDPPVASTGEAPQLVPPDAPGGYTRALRYAVVGSTEHDPRIALPEGVAEGDLLVLVTPGRCEVAHVLADEGDSTVRLTVVVGPPPFGRPPPYPTGSPAVDWPWREEASSTGLAGEGFVEPRCDDRTVGQEMLLAPVELVRVPLDRPLDGRRVVDGPTGTDVLSVASRAG